MRGGRFAGIGFVAAIGLACVAGCAFPPDLGEGRIACGANDSCPPAYHCASDARCYKAGGGPDLASSPADLAMSVGDMTSLPDFGPCLPTCNVACSPCCEQTCTDPTSCDLTCPVGGCDCRLGCTNTAACSINCTTAGRCTGTVDNATTTSLTCADGSTCNFVCSGTSTCLLNCRGGAQCSVRCVAPAVCSVNGPCMNMMSCPNNTTVCNGSCP